jgi:transposase InsO family protein
LVDPGMKPGLSSAQSAELVAARRRIRELEAEVDILRRASAALKDVVPPKARSPVIAELVTAGHEAQQCCRVLEASHAGYYDWGSRAPSARQIRHAWLTDLITKAHHDSRGTYGSPRVRAELVLGRGITIGRDTVALLMARAGLKGLPTRRQLYRAPGLVTAEDLVDRHFGRSEPDAPWVTDITEHPTREGKLFCCVVLDVYSRRVVGWSVDARQDATLTSNALGMAIENRRPVPGGIVHSDHGTQFTAWAFTERAKKPGLLPSMGTVGDAYDNAVIEAFWGRMQTELLDCQRWVTRVQLANAIFEYLEIFHNRQRRHSSLGMLTPIEYEKLDHTKTNVA